MNALATLPDGVPVVRQPSAALAEAMRVAVQAHEAGRHPLTPDRARALEAEARSRLAMVETALGRTADRATIEAWVMMVIVAIGHPRDPDTIAAKQAVLAEALASVPRRCLTKRSAAKVAQDAGDFFPSLAKLLDSIAGESAELVRERSSLQAVLAIASPPAPKPAKTAADVDHAQQVARTVMAETTARLAAVGAASARAVAEMEPHLSRIGVAAAEAGKEAARIVGASAVRASIPTPAQRLAAAEQVIAKGGPGAGPARMRAQALRRSMETKA